MTNLISLIKYNCKAGYDYERLENYSCARAGLTKIDDKEYETVEHHLQICNKCRQYYEEYLDIGVHPLKY
ncbi:hypothetical protein D6777_00060 [Candidatus Woesearchaeota archaeon]|nr:MAG: hypothetical protein D6777_00060 [Candidatus Woesearchaeota archaeon]